MKLLDVTFYAEHMPAVSISGRRGKVAPRLPAKNDWTRTTVVGSGRGARSMSHPSSVQKGWCGEWRRDGVLVKIGAFAARLAQVGIRCHPHRPLVTTGHLELSVGVLSPTRRHLEDGELRPRLDSDACLYPVKDMLQKVGVVADDVLIRRDFSSSGVGPLALRVRLVRCDGPDLSILPDPRDPLFDAADSGPQV